LTSASTIGREGKKERAQWTLGFAGQRAGCRAKRQEGEGGGGMHACLCDRRGKKKRRRESANKLPVVLEAGGYLFKQEKRLGEKPFLRWVDLLQQPGEKKEKGKGHYLIDPIGLDTTQQWERKKGGEGNRGLLAFWGEGKLPFRNPKVDLTSEGREVKGEKARQRKAYPTFGFDIKRKKGGKTTTSGVKEEGALVGNPKSCHDHGGEGETFL